jgi:hypothetical protein
MAQTPSINLISSQQQQVDTSMGVDDHIFDLVRFYEETEVWGLSRAEREQKWQELIQYVDVLIRSVVRHAEEDIREEEDKASRDSDFKMGALECRYRDSEHTD